MLLAGGDMPAMVGDVLGLLVQHVVDGADAAALIDGEAWRPLPSALRRAAALAAAVSMPPGSGLRDVLERLDVEAIPEARWRALDPEARTLFDVDTQGDLDRLPPGLS